MTGVSIDSVDDHLLDLDARDEPGTAPGDRRFRPDVEGLRAVAIVLVVLYHGSLQATERWLRRGRCLLCHFWLRDYRSPAQRALVRVDARRF